LANYATSIGVNSKANSHSSISIGRGAVVSGQNAIGIGTQTQVNGVGTVAVGSNTNVSSKNVSTLGSNITVPAGRDGAVVLGHGSDASKDTDVIAVHSAKIGDTSKLTYSGFAGDLGGTNDKGENKPAAKNKQGNFVSIGSEDNERQIKHVAAGRITENSTDALNGSQLYSVAKTLGNAAEGLADTLGVDLNEDGTVKNKFSQPLTVAEGSNYAKPADAGDVKTALTNLNNYVNAGWNITASGNDYKNNVSVGHTVNFVGSGNVDVDGSTIDGVRTVNISVDSPLDYATTKAEVDGKEVDVVKANDGKWYPKDQVDEDNNPKDGAKSIPSSEIVKKGAKLTDSDTENYPYEKGNAYTYDDKGNITATGYDKTKPESKDEITAGKNGVQLNNVGWATQPDQAVNKDQLDQTVNKSGFYVQQNGKSTLDGKTDSDKVSDTEKVTPNDVVNFVNGNGTVIKAVTTRDANGVDTTTVSVDVDTSKLNVPKGANTIAYNDKGEQIVKVDDKYYKPSDLTNGKPNTGAVEQKLGTPAADKPVDQAKNGLVDLANSNDGNAITVKDAQNLGWVVSTSDNKAVAPVKNADIVDFKAEAGTGITVKGESENGKMTVTVGNDYFKANVTDKTAKAAKATGPNSVAIGGGSDAAVENAVAIGNGATVGAKAAKGSVAIGAGAQAGKAHTGAYSLDPSATVAGKPSDATRVVSVGSEGNEAQIQNVAAGVVSEKSTDAVNGSQLHATNQSINRLGDTVNNIGGNVTRLSDKVDNMDRDYRAGIAGSNAAASLPQVYLPGKSMVAAAAGTFKGQNALAVGYSSISDNGKLIWKAQANLNSRADVGVGVGMGYLW